MLSNNRLRVLLFHKVSPAGKPDRLTVTATQLEKYLQVIEAKGYNTISLSELVNHITETAALPPKPLLLTFDDGYRDNYTVAYPLLKKYRAKANIFLVSNFVKSESVNCNHNPGDYLQMDDIKNMDPELIEFALHSENHYSYDKLSVEEIEQDIKKCQSSFQAMGVSYQPCLAYPYGHYAKKNKAKQNELFQLLDANNIKLAFRIGNRINKLPLKDLYRIQRIEICGDERLWKFKIALSLGRKIFLK